METCLSIPSSLSHRSTVVFPKSKAIPFQFRCRTTLRCVNYGGEEEGEGELEWLTMGKLEEKCGEIRKGSSVVELLECLEREAIMGEDEGRDPRDYNRRAKMFDTSSRVFQALKQRNDNQQH